MSIEQIIKMWKDPASRESLSGEQMADMPANPAGFVAKELDESELAVTAGGHYCGCGYICSYSAECGCRSGETYCSWSRCYSHTH